MHRTIVVGSPRSQGRAAALANAIFEACIEDCPEDGVSIVSVDSVDVAPCIGCDACKVALARDDVRYPEIPEKGDPLAQCPMIYKSDANAHQCVFDDEMAEVRKHLDAADELIVVAPVYFAGAPAQLKAVLDRFQPYYFSDVRTRTKERRPVTLHVVRDGGDPHGFEPLIGVVRSALSVAGFRLERVLDWIDCFDDDNEIVSDAAEYEL